MNTISPKADSTTTLSTPAPSPVSVFEPPFEIVRSKRGVTMIVDVPGVLPGNLHLACQDGWLQIWGSRAKMNQTLSAEESTSRWNGPFAAELPIPEWVEAARIEKKLEMGVLTVYFPKRRESIHRA